MQQPRNRVKAVFDVALEIASPAERAAYLDRQCADAPELRQKVEALLRAYADAGHFLGGPAADGGATAETRAAFGEAFTIWLDRISAGRFDDTNRMFVPPKCFDLRVSSEGAPQYWAEQALALLRPTFDPQNRSS